MDGEKIQQLNYAIQSAIQPMRDAAEENPNAQVYVRALKFSNGAQWMNPKPIRIEDYRWIPLSADGMTDMGKALSMVAEELKMPPMEERALPPVLVLITDAQPTDDFDGGLKKLMSEPWGVKAVRIGIAIGRDADLDVLQQFIGHSELRPLEAKNAATLVKQIKWVSTAILKAASSPTSQTKEQIDQGVSVPLPEPPEEIKTTVGVDDVW